MVLDGPINGDGFEAYVEQVLVPELRPATSSSWTTSPATRGRRSASSSRRPAPSCSSCRPTVPDFNPIEKAFSKLKALLRKAAERTVDGLWNAIGRLVDLFTPDGMRQLLPPLDMMQIDRKTL